MKKKYEKNELILFFSIMFFILIIIVFIFLWYKKIWKTPFFDSLFTIIKKVRQS